MPYIIGIGHHSGHGKDTVANAMVAFANKTRPDLRVIKMSWAHKLKDICFQLYSWAGMKPMEYYETDEGRTYRNVPLEEIHLTPVEIWVKMGTDAIRNNVYKNTWVDYVKHHNNADILICPDTRNYNELLYCNHTIKVHNPRVPNREGVSIDDNLQDAHWDNVMINATSKQELITHAEVVFANILELYSQFSR